MSGAAVPIRIKKPAGALPAVVSALVVGEMCYLRELPPGGRFDSEGITGWVQRTNAGSVSVMLDKGAEQQEFTDSAGATVRFTARMKTRTEWSLGTRVRYLGQGEGEEEVPQKFSLKQFKEEDDVMAKSKGKAAKLAKGNGALKAKKVLTFDNDCQCGCGAKVRRNFAVGHDARFYGWLTRVSDGRMKYDELNRHVKAALPSMQAVKKALAAHGA